MGREGGGEGGVVTSLIVVLLNGLCVGRPLWGRDWRKVHAIEVCLVTIGKPRSQAGDLLAMQILTRGRKQSTTKKMV